MNFEITRFNCILNYKYLFLEMHISHDREISRACIYVYGSHTLYNVKTYMLTSLQLTWQLIAMVLGYIYMPLEIESEIHLEHL